MTNPTENQPLFFQEDYGCSSTIYSMLTDDLWPYITEIVKSDCNNIDMSRLDIQNHLISKKITTEETNKKYDTLNGIPSPANKVSNRYMNGVIQKAVLKKSQNADKEVSVSLPQDEKVVHNVVNIDDYKKQPQNPKLETKQDRCSYYRQNPDGFLFYLKKSEKREITLFTFLHLVPIFRIVSKGERKNLTLSENVDKQRDNPEIIESSEGRFELTGPVLCTQDLLVFYALMHIYASDKTEGLSISTDYSQLYKILNPKSKYNIGFDNAKVLKRSLVRLSRCNIKKYDSGKYLNEFDGSLIMTDDTTPSRHKKLQIQFNQNFINHFIYNSFAKVNLDVLLELSSYELKLYSYVLVRGFKLGIDYKISTIFDVIYSKQSEVSQKVKLTKVGEAIKGLIKKGLLEPKSGLKKSSSFEKESHYFINLV